MSRSNQAIRYTKIAALILLPVVLIGISFYFGMQDQSKDNFTVSGTTSGSAVNIAIVGPDYTGSTDWMTIGDLKRKAWSPYEIQINTAAITPGTKCHVLTKVYNALSIKTKPRACAGV